MLVTLKLSPDLARSLRSDDQTGDKSVSHIMRECDRVGGHLKPLSAQCEGEISLFFVIETDSVLPSDTIIERLMTCKGVDGAYIKGEDRPA